MAGSFLSCAACLRRINQVAVPRRALVSASTIPARSAISTGRRSRRFSTAQETGSVALAEPSDAHVITPFFSGAKLRRDGSRVMDEKEEATLNRIVAKQLEYLRDPLHIADRVSKLLRVEEFDQALIMTRQASLHHNVVVSWNHLIDYQLRQQRLKPAIKLLNDMKKRGQLPNVQTYTVIFRGLARSDHPALAVSEAIKQYHVLLNDARLEPNSIHLNAVLNVCAKADDMDSLFLVAETINDSVRAPDAFTYTIIFNALRSTVIDETKSLSEEQIASNIRKTVDRAKGLWSEIMAKWAAGRLIIDEQLVCSMARVLLTSPRRQDKEEVLDLLQQAMNIPNLTKPVASDPFRDEEMKGIATSGSAVAVPSSKALYAIPRQNTLALLLATLKMSRQTTVGIKYWNLLVRHYGIIPDKDNWLRMFLMLRTAKASAHAAAILDLVPDEHLDAKLFRLAMETCVSDNINRNSLDHSIIILESMMNRLPLPDLQALRLHLRVALVCHAHHRAEAQRGNAEAARREYGAQIGDALERLWNPYREIHRHYFQTKIPRGRPGTKENKRSVYNDKREVVALARHMFSAFNKVINERMLPEQDLAKFRPMGARINREIQTFYAGRDFQEPNIGRTDLSKDEMMDEQEPDRRQVSNLRVGGDFVWDTQRPFEPKSLRENTQVTEPRQSAKDSPHPDGGVD
ncbi:hypothetical protein HIM_04488 [Hirsutella minnesotensis 3608]|uniref:Pentacotripeptide-repeat region of PRORP domain-containing protein n=1 Tax=Hirsutella minnesotensis 3608 TaxID=1043627 RepID=A0A0F8A1A0_9HYPO|nr:hypothetical protein HIM_04488 [Hirsutella minnesotensis 3608]